MNKRYQVFISSTFTDLKEERQAVLRAVLELDHMPAGMELFPAADDTAWQLIKDIIDASDYYILIIGGRYGSIDETGLGYTEREYDYAVSSKKPVIPLLHANPDELPRGKTDTNESAWAKLEAFRSKVEQRHTCVYWKNADELKAQSILGLTTTVRRHPAIGWIRADQIPSEATLSELLKLRERISELEAASEHERTQPPPGTEALRQGDDTFSMEISFDAREELSDFPYHVDTSYRTRIAPTWNEIFAAVAPSMITEASETNLDRELQGFLSEHARESLRGDEEFPGRRLIDFSVDGADLDTCRIQLRALGLIQEGHRQRSIKDRAAYWMLTPYGDHIMTQLRALRRKPAASGPKPKVAPKAKQ